MKTNAEKLKFLADTVVLASEDLTKQRVPMAHALLQKGLDAVGKIEGLDAEGKVSTDREIFEATMISRGYKAEEFDGFMAEGEWAYYSKIANCMFGAWTAASVK